MPLFRAGSFVGASLLLAACMPPPAAGHAPVPTAQKSPAAVAGKKPASPAASTSPTPEAPPSPTPGVSPSPVASPSPSPSPHVVTAESVLLKVGYSGGLCVYGGCYGETTIRYDGTYTVTSGPDETQHGQVPKADVDALVTLIAKTDFKAIEAVKFTGTCPTAYDGGEATYTFDTPGGAETFASCEVAIDETSPLFVAVDRVLKPTQAP